MRSPLHSRGEQLLVGDAWRDEQLIWTKLWWLPVSRKCPDVGAWPLSQGTVYRIGTQQFVSLLPTMVPTALFSSFGEDDYNQDDSDNDSDSEEQSEAKEEPPAVEDKKDEQAKLAASLQQTLKEALKAAGTTRLMQQKRRQATPPQPPPTSQTATANTNAFLAPFLLSGLTANTSSNGTIFQLPQGCVYTNSSNGNDGGATANSLLINSTKGDEPSSQANPLLSFPFQFSFQQVR
ncbi:unnamed protein product [Heligmosomoides polygyrus]|uniref:Uncharacterized protein n=1 Tax=Heligmosomoides polygyrus TaxID=6339 RepID=A0A183FNT8_HELPZ|nr:unnamed protein product [Heligmosomoides polygyrus]